MLTVGTKGQQFIIRNLLIEANYQSNPNKVKCGTGVLIHFTIDDTVKEWNLTGNIFVLNASDQPYYIYAKCVKNSSSGIFEVTTTQYNTDEADYYYFLIGVVHSVIDNVRGVSLTYGQTTINGKFITTGRVQSIDGYNFFDLDTGQFNIGNETSGLDWNVSKQNKLTLRGALVQTDNGEPLPIENSFEVQYSSNGSSWHSNFLANDIYMRQRSWGGTWSDAIRIVGEDGEDGEKGNNGEDGNFTDYIFRRSNSQPSTPTGTNPSGWLGSPPSGTSHLWMSKADKRANGSLLGAWSTPARLTGEDGQDGNDGAGIVFRGNFSSSTVYYNNALRRDVVKYNSVYYLYKGTNGVALAWSSTRWENFGAQFESVATNLLLAENANIADWIIKGGKITSQNQYNGNPSAQFDGKNGKITLRSPKTIYTQSLGTVEVEQKIEIDSTSGEIKSTHQATTNQLGAEARLDSDGIYADFAGLKTGENQTEKRTAIMGIGNGKLSLYGSPDDTAVIGVYGEATNHASSFPVPTYGGYFKELRAEGLYVKTKQVTYAQTLDKYDTYVIAYGNYTLTLPNFTTQVSGRVLIISSINNITLKGYGSTPIQVTPSTDSSNTMSLNRKTAILVKFAGFWRASIL